MSAQDRFPHHQSSLAELDRFLTEQGAEIWPAGATEPLWSGPTLSVDFADGCYLNRWPEGGLRLLLRVDQGRVGPWLFLESGAEAGTLSLGNCGEKFYSDGRLEDFSPWDDSSEPYPAPISLGEWALSNARQFVIKAAQPEGQTASPETPLMPPVPAWVMQPGDDVPDLHLPLSGRGALPQDLDNLLTEFCELRMVCPSNCYRYLVKHRDWDPGWARDFTILAPHAAYSAFYHRRRQPRGNLLYPLWDQPGKVGEIPLADLPLYQHVYAAAMQTAEAHKPGQRHWANELLDVLASGVSDRSAPDPVSWTLPPQDMDGFARVAISVSLMLRQEASRGGELAEYLRGVDGERFFHAGGLVGAFLQGGYLSGEWTFQPENEPWPACSESFARHRADLARLIAGLDEAAVLDRFPHYADSYQSPIPVRLVPTWRQAPVLAALGHWAHNECGQGQPGPELEPTVYNLGRFINRHGDLLRRRFDAFEVGQLFWEYEADIKPWPQPGMNDMGGWDKYWRLQRFEARERGELFVKGPDLRQTLPGFNQNAFLHRLEVASSVLVRGGGGDDEGWKRHEQELRAFLNDNPRLSPAQLQLLQEHVLGPEAVAGPAYQRLLLSCLWVLSQWSDPRQRPELVFPALRLAQWILPAL